MSSLTPDQARRQLSDASNREALGRSHSRVGAVFTASLGCLVAATLAVVSALRGTPVAVAGSMAVYLAVLSALISWQQRSMRVAARGWGRSYLTGFGVTMTLYIIGIGWESFAFPGWRVFAPYCVLVAIPSLLAAVKMRSR